MTDVEGKTIETLVWERDRVRHKIEENRAELERLEAELRRRGYVSENLEVAGADTSSPPGRAPGREVVNKKGGNGRWLQLERVKCGKPRCKKCADGIDHGPYYYLYGPNPKTGRYTSKYVGKPANLTDEMRREFGIEGVEDQTVEV